LVALEKDVKRAMHAPFYSDFINYIKEVQPHFVGRPQGQTPLKGPVIQWVDCLPAPSMVIPLVVAMRTRCYHGVTATLLPVLMASTTTLKLPEKLKARIARLARETGRSAHALMIEALEREVTREERMKAFVRDALAAKADIEAGGAMYRAEDVHAWMERLAKGEKPPRPAPWRR